MTQQPNRSANELALLEEQHETHRKATLKALEALSAVRRQSLFQLQKTQILFRYLNWKQQEHIECHCNGAGSLQRIYAVSTASLAGREIGESGAAAEIAGNAAMTVITECSRHTPGTASYLNKVKTVRKNIVQFKAIQARAHELIEAVAKSTAVFNHQYKTVCRELFPLGFVSKLRRSIRRFFRYNYYNWKEIGTLQNLGTAAGFVLKMADAPVLGVRR